MKTYSSGAVVNFVNDNSIAESNGVELSSELYNKLFPQAAASESENDSDFRFVLIRLLGAPDYFKHFTLHRVTSVSAGTSLSVSLVNQSNLLKFNDQITISKCLVQSVDPSKIPKLAKVFVQVPESVYQILEAKTAADVRDMFATKFLVKSAGVVNSGDIVREINGQIKLCEPVSQGKIDPLVTDIILIKEPSEGRVSNEDVEFDSVGADEAANDVDIDIDFSVYSGTVTGNDFTAIKELDLIARPLADKLTIEGQSPSLWAKEDLDLFVFINSADLIKLGFPVFNGDSVKISTSSSSRVVKVLTVIEPNKTFELGSVYLSPILLINLGINSLDNAVVNISPLGEGKLQTLLSNLFPIAKSVTISRVALPITLDKTYQQSFFGQLKSTFHSQFKCVTKGDLIPVVIDSVLAKTMFDTFSQIEQNDELVIPTGDPDVVAWFKISEIASANNDSDQFVIDPFKTRMISSGVEYMQVAENLYSQWTKYLQVPTGFPYTKTIVNDKLIFNYASELSKILSTCLNSNGKVKLKTTILLNSMSRGLGKTSVMRDITLAMGLNLIELDCFDFINPGAELKTIGSIRGKIDKLISDGPKFRESGSSFNVVYLKHIENLCVKTNENEQGSNVSTSLSMKVVQLLQLYLDEYSNLIIVMSCNDADKLNEGLRLMVKFQIDFGVPSEKERLEIFKYLIQKEIAGTAEQQPDDYMDEFEEDEEFDDLSSYSFSKRDDVTFKTLALQSAGLTPRDLISILKNAKLLAIQRVKEIALKTNCSFKSLVTIGNGGLIQLTPEDFNKSINEARNQFSDSIGAPRIPNVKWEDIGGLDLVKDEILDTIDMPLKHPELFNNGLKKRSGILFYGPPGTGKTLLAKAIATNFSLNFFSVKGPELLNMYIGESEANVRRVFQRARDAKPCVIFFDELDSVAPKRGNQGDSGGVMDRIVSQLLAELDGMSGGEGGTSGDGVFVVGATNRPDLLDEALLRPGRFDKLLYLGISDTNEKQTKILEALTRKFKLADDVDLLKISENCSFTFTGADFYALCSDSMLNAMTRTANLVDLKIKKFNADLEKEGKPPISSRWWFDNAATEADINVLVSMEDFEKAQLELNPSVSAEELEHYLRVRENFEGGKESAKEGNQPALHSENDQVNGDVQLAFMNKVQELVGEKIQGIVDEKGENIA